MKKRIIGYLLIAAPFIVIAVIIIKMLGWLTMVAAFSASLLVTGTFYVGAYLIGED